MKLSRQQGTVRMAASDPCFSAKMLLLSALFCVLGPCLLFSEVEAQWTNIQTHVMEGRTDKTHTGN